MDFLKKHYEKIVLAVALVALIASAIFLALSVSAISSELRKRQIPSPRSPLAPHAELETYSNAIQSLAQPPLWTNAAGFDPILPPRDHYVRDDILSTNEFPVILMSVVRKPFKLLFKIYSYDASTKEGYNFQINFQFRSRTFFTPTWVIGSRTVTRTPVTRLPNSKRNPPW